MADQKVPYQILKKVMATCAAAEYRNISLAVTKKELPANTGGG
jgi:biopolymer transport protein ExbD